VAHRPPRRKLYTSPKKMNVHLLRRLCSSPFQIQVRAKGEHFFRVEREGKERYEEINWSFPFISLFEPFFLSKPDLFPIKPRLIS